MPQSWLVASPSFAAPYRSIVLLRISKSQGKKRHVTPFQCTPAPPRPSPGRNEPNCRIGGLRAIVARGQRLARSVLNEPVAHGVGELVMDAWDLEVRRGVAVLAAFESDDRVAGFGELVGD